MVLRHVLADRRHGCSRICCPVRQTSVSSFLFFDIIPCSPSCRLTRFGNAIYFPLSKIAWGAFLGWITFACMRGIGDVIDMLLSAPIWIPLARMTYSAYLVHPVVLTAYFAAVQNVRSESSVKPSLHIVSCLTIVASHDIVAISSRWSEYSLRLRRCCFHLVCNGSRSGLVC
eukprot:m.377097 g.377097  ORF g.377097 m.377097 type:complete len:172 (-) comp56191_c0_seq29:118-633(-)